MRELKVIVTGKRACFTRPEMKAERVSYDVPTPGALEGLLKSVYWKPAIRYIIDQIIVFNPIEFETVRRNEVKSKVSYSKMKSLMKETEGKEGQRISVKSDPTVYASLDRTQRSSLILKNVKYGIAFHIEQTGLQNEREKKEGNPQVKHEEEFLRRCRKGQCFRTPCLGCSEFPANIQLIDDFDLSQVCTENHGEKDLGFMLYRVAFRDHGKPANSDWNHPVFSDEADSIFYRPIMVDGVIDVKELRRKQNVDQRTE
jgi:CRISPR-associated protein Cas5d